MAGRSRGPVAVDPPGCGCTECLTGEYVPLEQASGVQVARLLAGAAANNTGLAFTLAPGQGPGTVHVTPLFAEDGAPVAGNAPDEPGWHLIEAGWELEAELLDGLPVPPGAAGSAGALPGESSCTDDAGCACPGRNRGQHDSLCEQGLREAYGSVGDAPEIVKQRLRARNRLVTGTVIAPGDPG